MIYRLINILPLIKMIEDTNINIKKYKIGTVIFDNPILNASGCWVMFSHQIDKLYNSNLGGIVMKTCTLNPKNGNIEPTYCCLAQLNVHFNSKGLPNPGYCYYKEILKNMTKMTKPFILSVAYSDNFNDLSLILTDYDNFVTKTSLIEINTSCPNTESEIIPYDLNKFKLFINNLKEINVPNLLLGIKLPPYLDKKLLSEIAKIIIESNVISFITLCNSIPNCLPLVNSDLMLSTIYGGMSGKLNKYISISNVKQFSDLFKKNESNIKIIGCGGIETIYDINDYIKMGADFVQLGSCFYDSTKNELNNAKIIDIINEFKTGLNKKN